MEKEYTFLCLAEEIARGYVFAKNAEEAKQKILNNDYDDVADTYDMNMKEITFLEEVKDWWINLHFYGRLTKEPEVRYTANTNSQVTVFTLAVNRRYNNEQVKADFFNLTSFGKTAEFCSKYYKKGQQVLVEGRIQNRTWEDDKGQKRYATDFIVENAYFADSNKNTNDTQESASDFVTVEDDEDLPF